MDTKEFTAGLAGLRGVRDEIKAVRKELAQLEADRDKRIVALGAYEKAKADRIAPAAGLSVVDVVALVPHLGPKQPEPRPADAAGQSAAAAPVPAPGPVGTLAPDLRRPQEPAAAVDDRADQLHDAAGDQEAQPPQPAPVSEPGTEDVPGDAAPALEEPAAAHDQAQPVPAAPAAGVQGRELPSIPAGEPGDAWCTPTPNLVSKRPNFTQQPRQMAFLDTNTGVLVHRDQVVRVDLGTASAAEILTAVYATVPDSVERIYITAGDPWHRDADRYPFLRDAVAAWLNAPVPGWQVESSRGKDRLAGHLVHPRNPVGRWQRGDQHAEIRSVGEWFDPGDADPATVRDAFVLLWKQLRHHWSDVVLMGAPSQTGRDLWSRTISGKTGSRWSEGYPVMSEEIRGLLHATAGQGRTELIVPPRVPEKLPQLVEYDRTFAYAKHTWASGVGAPRRITAQAFAAMSEKEQTNALFAPSHWQIRVTVPDGWNHVGILPAPAAGDRAWHYPAEPGQTFVTWAGGAEVNLALRNPIAPWRIEILDGLLWESGTPLREWSTKLKDAWSSLQALAAVHGDERQRLAAHLASRAVRSILLYGIGGFAQRPRITTSSVPVGREHEIPAGAQIIGTDGQTITWQRHGGFSRDPYAHPEWAAGVWSGARAALLSTKMREDNVFVGALHLPPGSVVAFRTDAIYTTADVDWPYHGQPGDYLKKGRLTGPFTGPRTEEELLSHQALGRAQFAEDQEAGR
ncbi:Mucin-19 [Streptomyces caniscabiei]|uniref:Mucin-19 n=1 Tax=Streptomyces caniscabiei TaxID=2746961 RepID=UPI000A381374|nr:MULTISPECIES: Mucin-19 [Streptomyces]MBP5880781.1 Mucin-19 [Streptomyces sp. LBUM 1477]